MLSPSRCGGQSSGNSRYTRSPSVRKDSRLVARTCSSCGFPDDALRQRSELVEDVLAAVEDQQHPPVAQERQQARASGRRS